MRRESGLSPPSRGSWTAYHAGVAAGLADRSDDAETMLRSITDERVRRAAERFIEVLPEPECFKAVASSLMVTQRMALRLPEVSPVHP